MSLKWTPALENRTVYPNPNETRRLAQRARERGVMLVMVEDGRRVDHFASDPRDGQRYYLTAYSCTCRQFIQSGSAGCQHLALLQVELGLVPEVVFEPEELAAPA